MARYPVIAHYLKTGQIEQAVPGCLIEQTWEADIEQMIIANMSGGIYISQGKQLRRFSVFAYDSRNPAQLTCDFLIDNTGTYFVNFNMARSRRTSVEIIIVVPPQVSVTLTQGNYACAVSSSQVSVLQGENAKISHL